MKRISLISYCYQDCQNRPNQLRFVLPLLGLSQIYAKEPAKNCMPLLGYLAFMNPDKLRLLMNSFIKSQFSYCPLIWMFHDRALNAKVNKIQGRALRIVYKNSHADYETLLKLDNAVSIHQRNLQYLMIEIYKTKKNLNPSFMSEIFEARDVQYNLRNKNTLGIPNAKTTSYGIETVRYLGQKLWQTLPHSVRESQSLTAFKKELRTYTIECDCRLCKTYISGLGFI